MNPARLVDDYARIIDTEFWKYFREEVFKARAAKAKTLESIEPDRLVRAQGEIAGMSFVLDLPERLIKQLQKENNH